jgi:hypothetical protein
VSSAVVTTRFAKYRALRIRINPKIRNGCKTKIASLQFSPCEQSPSNGTVVRFVR